VLVEALLRESARTRLRDLLPVRHELLAPRCHLVLEPLPDVVRQGHAGLVIEPFRRRAVELVAHEVELGADLLGRLAGVLDLETGEPELEVEAEAEVEGERLVVEGPPGEEEDLARAPVELEPLILPAPLEVALVPAHLLL